jgi:hypothetical protein
VKSKNRNWMLMLLAYAFAVFLPANHAVAATGDKARQLSQGESAKISGLILSRDGDRFAFTTGNQTKWLS